MSRISTKFASAISAIASALSWRRRWYSGSAASPVVVALVQAAVELDHVLEGAVGALAVEGHDRVRGVAEQRHPPVRLPGGRSGRCRARRPGCAGSRRPGSGRAAAGPGSAAAKCALDRARVVQRVEARPRRASGQKSVQVKERSGFGRAIIMEVPRGQMCSACRVQREVAVAAPGRSAPCSRSRGGRRARSPHPGPAAAPRTADPAPSAPSTTVASAATSPSGVSKRIRPVNGSSPVSRWSRRRSGPRARRRRRRAGRCSARPG